MDAAVRLIGGLRRHLDPAYEYTLVERGQHMRGQLADISTILKLFWISIAPTLRPGMPLSPVMAPTNARGVTSCACPTSMWSLDMGPDSCLRGSGCILPFDFASAFLAGRCGAIVSSSTSPTLS